MRKSIFLILQNIRSLYNVGAIFRSADAFGIQKIYLCGITAYPPKRQMQKISKTALGAEKSVSWEYHKQTATLVKKLKKDDRVNQYLVILD
ncbi:MAG: TrmH family RNA methyltransferase [Patescibacteria group bacterium]